MQTISPEEYQAMSAAIDAGVDECRKATEGRERSWGEIPFDVARIINLVDELKDQLAGVHYFETHFDGIPERRFYSTCVCGWESERFDTADEAASVGEAHAING